MKVFILCGGFGTRLDHEGKIIAKPMVKIGKKPILIHLIEFFSRQGHKEFVLCLGHKSETIINFFIKDNYRNIKVLSKKKKLIKIYYKCKKINLLINLVFTGKDSGTAGRIMIAYKMLSLAREDILMTYGDGLSDIKIKKLINYHKQKKALITISAVRPKERYGILDIKNGRVNNFNNRKQKAGHYINGGFMVISHKVIMKLKKTSEYFEIKPMMNAIRKKKLFAFRHEKFWKSLDTLKDKNDFNKMYKENFRPWMK